ncbi:hypothetical protein NQZ68_023799 [Dissostichus eleginoides]|nr:hypothetical protein NQZ68_023799 [Dissostichus eleginoides]
MDVYLVPFIKPKIQTEKLGPDKWNKAVLTWRHMEPSMPCLGLVGYPTGRVSTTHWLAPFIFSHSPQGAWHQTPEVLLTGDFSWKSWPG